jgi:hypothetical protein
VVSSDVFDALLLFPMLTPAHNKKQMIVFVSYSNKTFTLGRSSASSLSNEWPHNTLNFYHNSTPLQARSTASSPCLSNTHKHAYTLLTHTKLHPTPATILSLQQINCFTPTNYYDFVQSFPLFARTVDTFLSFASRAFE